VRVAGRRASGEKCRVSGESLVAVTTAASGRPGMPAMQAFNHARSEVVEEKTFFKERGVVITNARFIVPTQMFAVSGITSVKMFRQEPRRGWAIFLTVIGALVVLGGISNGSGVTLVGLLMAGIGVAILATQKTRYHVLLKTASGEAKAVESTDMPFIERVVDGLSRSIVHRG
jgi:hypothetical protein